MNKEGRLSAKKKIRNFQALFPTAKVCQKGKARWRYKKREMSHKHNAYNNMMMATNKEPVSHERSAFGMDNGAAVPCSISAMLRFRIV